MKRILFVIFMFSAFLVFSQNNDNIVPQIKSYIAASPKSELSENDKKNIILLIEEEKLAHDVYLALFKKWNLRPFNNILQSEQTHIDSLDLIIKKYGLNFKLSSVGKFVNPEFQKLYESLVNDGNQSAVKAYQVGALIEELDITDIKNFLKTTDNKDVKIVYLNLMKGSRNHLRTYYSQIKNNKSDYIPKYLGSDEFKTIINSKSEQGFVVE
jgi:hypothetical protein